ncbi:hypothetical protein [Streptomyces sp. NPDC058861]|uniref:hypothetical protein n=1 Tax=Streptomyces sp. NPDC058861 TaxID=3346653 RepID=UPI00367AB27C
MTNGRDPYDPLALKDDSDYVWRPSAAAPLGVDDPFTPNPDRPMSARELTVKLDWATPADTVPTRPSGGADEWDPLDTNGR